MPRQKISREQMRAQKTGALKDCSCCLSYWILAGCCVTRCMNLCSISISNESVCTWSRSSQGLETVQLGDCHVWPSSSGVHVRNSTFAHSLTHALSGHTCSSHCVRTTSHSSPLSQAGVTGRVSFPLGFSQWGWKLAGTLFICAQTKDTYTKSARNACVPFHKANSRSLGIETFQQIGFLFNPGNYKCDFSESLFTWTWGWWENLWSCSKHHTAQKVEQWMKCFPFQVNVEFYKC